MSITAAWDSGIIAAPNAPCSRRKRTICSMFCAAPHRAEVMVKPAIEMMKTCLRPRRPASQPLTGVMIAEAMM